MLLSLSTACVLTACASAPKPVVVKLTMQATSGINPDQRGRPSPVQLKLFELKSLSSFERADFFSLFDRERETLGPELVARDEFVFKPGDRIAQERKLAPDTKFLGVVVGYRDLERSQWRMAIPVETAAAQPLMIEVDANRIAVKGK
ncbi:MAG TPA: type VI secretion system lipoprotein TssJ [Burkholderiaceae bacterium]|nr:type VI secretion system lipoprotein TssJ [Burkholderiaceae bacterium]